MLENEDMRKLSVEKVQPLEHYQGWRAVCAERCKHGSGRGTRHTLWVNGPYSTFLNYIVWIYKFLYQGYIERWPYSKEFLYANRDKRGNPHGLASHETIPYQAPHVSSKSPGAVKVERAGRPERMHLPTKPRLPHAGEDVL